MTHQACRYSFILLVWNIFFFVPLSADCNTLDEEDFAAGIVVDLRQPVYSQGVISTVSGGVITGPELRIQATNIIYTRKRLENQIIFNIEAEGNLMLEFGKYVFVGDRLEYDFQTKTGVIYNGRTMAEPWFFGGERIYLCADGSYLVDNAFVTTSENYVQDWQITAEEAHLSEEQYLSAKNVRLRILQLPVFWIPSFKANLETIFDSPIRYSIKWGGNQGHRFGLYYELFSWNRWKTFLRLDYRLRCGPGGGIETEYHSLDHRTNFESTSYAASDSSIIHPGQHLRFRFQGEGNTLLMDDRVSVHLSYDKLSDIDMATDYNDRGIQLGIAGRTELLVRRKEERWISNLITRLKINDFQTLKQELPTFETSWMPFEIGNTKWISDNVFKAAYLDFAYGNNILRAHSFNSSRIELAPLYYRNFQLGKINTTPEIGGYGIAYSNSPQHSAKWLALGKLGCTLNLQLWKRFGNFKHVITPYAQYTYYTSPTVSPNDHYIFDIEDGWYRLNMLRLGVTQSLYHKQQSGYICRKVFADIYANIFFDTHTFPEAIPKAYADLTFFPFPWLKYTIGSGWDFIHGEVDHYNARADWTVSADAAVAVEFRHRSSYDWRKADHTNFILDSFRSISQLRHSQLSDRRDTILFHLFYRFHPNWAFEAESRHGWNRHTEPPYNEFEIDLIGTLPSAWNFKLTYQHREDDDRVSVYMSIGIKRPDFEKSCSIVPCLGF